MASISSTSWTGARAGIPTLDDVLARYPDARVIIEIKDGTEACAAAVVDSVRRPARSTGCVSARSACWHCRPCARANREMVTSAARKEGQRALYRSWSG